MANQQKRLILANGEAFVANVSKKPGGGTSALPRSYEEARNLVQSSLKLALSEIASLPAQKQFADELILCLRLHPDMTAKSNEPQNIFKMVPGLYKVGSRSYTVNAEAVKQTPRLKKRIIRTAQETITGRLLFTRGDRRSYNHLLSLLDQPESDLTDDFKKDIRRIETYNLLSVDEQFLGFPSDWTEGRVEIVFHPSTRPNQQLSHRLFLEQLLSHSTAIQPDTGGMRIASYPHGPTFVSCWISRKELQALEGANPLRAAHPLKLRSMNKLRGGIALPAPPPPQQIGVSTIKIGMFDGGVDPNHPLLKGYVEEDHALSISGPANPDDIAHGTAVAGVILYGPLNSYNITTPLPPPTVSVVSIRALPSSNSSDPDLYESIDVIEQTVPARPDIKTYNISFGPDGPILDDSISRFTYSLDILSEAHKVTFYVAVGNDGDLPDGENRIQAPADLVNGIGVGAFTMRNSEKVHASYSCKGPGRECGKVKPDLVAFGGCDQLPIHLVSTEYGKKVLWQGTSFAAPAVAAMGGRLTGGFERATSLLARALLIHSAKHPTRGPDTLVGHGIAESDFDEILRCEHNSFTVVFQSQVRAKGYVKLPLLLPPDLILPGMVSFTWTIATLPVVDPNQPSDYTACGIEDTFYPRSDRFQFSPPKKGSEKAKKIILVNPDQTTINNLTGLGWRQSQYPVSKSPGRFAGEDELRESTNKWEPLVKKTVKMKGTGIKSPFLILHAIPRNNWDGSINYAAVVTVQAPKATSDIYARVLQAFPALQPIRLRTEAEIRIRG